MVVKIILTKHARLKLRIYRTHKVKISIKNIQYVLDSSRILDDGNWPILKAIGTLDGEHSLVVIYKTEDAKHIIITFWPAEKGRYESKIQ